MAQARAMIDSPPPDPEASIRRDLTHLKVYAIDSEDTNEARTSPTTTGTTTTITTTISQDARRVLQADVGQSLVSVTHGIRSLERTST